MARLMQWQVRNLLLSRMCPDDFDLLQPYLARVSHEPGDLIAQRGAPVNHVIFPEGAIAALLAVMGDDTRLAVGLVGHEGLLGGPLLHSSHWPYEVVIRGAESTSIRIEASRLHQACRQSPALHDLLLRFSGNFLLQVARTSISNLSEPLERRMAQWILLYHDRLEGDSVPITHQEIGIMLGVRRASATDVIHVLEGTGAIRGLRGCIVVRDRALLEELAGETYGDVEADYRRRIGPFGKPAIGSVPAVARVS